MRAVVEVAHRREESQAGWLVGGKDRGRSVLSLI